MSDISLNRSASHTRPGVLEVVIYRLVLTVLMLLSAVAVALTWFSSNRKGTSFWMEVRQAAHAVAGYAFKY